MNPRKRAPFHTVSTQVPNSEIPRQSCQKVGIRTPGPQTKEILPPPPQNASRTAQLNTKIRLQIPPRNLPDPQTKKAAAQAAKKLGTRYSQLEARSSLLP